MDSAPADAVARLRAAPEEMGMEALQLTYPAPPALVLPADLAPIVFEWQLSGPKPAAAMPAPPPAAGMPAPPPPADPMKADPMKDKAKADADPLRAYELRARSDRADVRVYVSTQSADFPRENWTQLLRQHTGETVRIELRGLRQSGAIVHAKPVELRVRAAPQRGVFYSFSTTARGLMRGELSRTHETLSVPSADVPGAPDTGCVGCHALSRDGKRALASVGGNENLFTWSFATREKGPSLDATEQSGGYAFGALDGSAARIARVQAGRLSIFNADSGALLGQTPAPLVAASTAPDWSPDGRSIAMVLQSDKGNSLATVAVAFEDGSLSEPQVLVTAGKDESFFWPVYSPDGAYIAYERRKGPARDAKDARLFLVRATGGEPIELNALRDKPMADASAPSFMPGDTPEHVYLVFASRRPVGSYMLMEGQQQLFAAALDLQLVAAGKDPSGQAFRLPFQQLTSSYLRAQWTPALRDCTRTDEVCDGTDDDCDGVVDNNCRTPGREICDNQVDEDLDGAVDEGCGCAFAEVCGNQKDEDCDLRADEQPCMPAPAMK